MDSLDPVSREVAAMTTLYGDLKALEKAVKNDPELKAAFERVSDYIDSLEHRERYDDLRQAVEVLGKYLNKGGT